MNKTANDQKELSQKDLDLATQVLMELRKKEEQQPDDPYTQMAQKLKQQKPQQEEESEEEEEVVKEEVKQPLTELEEEMERLKKLSEMQAKLNDMPLKKWGKWLKIGLLISLIVGTAYMNGAFSENAKFKDNRINFNHMLLVFILSLIDTELWSEMFGWNNLIITLKESWFMFIAIAAYLLMKRYNDRLDQEEIKLLEEQIKEEERKKAEEGGNDSEDDDGDNSDTHSRQDQDADIQEPHDEDKEDQNDEVQRSGDTLEEEMRQKKEQ